MIHDNSRPSARSWTFELPKRDAPLSANARVHWAVKADHNREVRWQARLLAIKALEGAAPPPAIDVEFVVHPPDGRVRDSDNLVPHLVKPVRDGICEALRYPDDRDERIGWTRPRFGSKTGDGTWRYLVTIRERAT